MSIEIRAIAADEQATAIETCELAFGWHVRPEDEIWKTFLPADRTFVAVDGDVFVGTGANYSFDLSVPGGSAPAAGLTMVGVLPSHRRRGILTGLMQRFFADARDHGESVSILWASEAAIYQRFGYGLASNHMQVTAERSRMRFLDDPGPQGKIALVSVDEALKMMPAVYDRVRASTPGMFARDETWWRNHRMYDPEYMRDGASPMWRAVLELDGRPEAYALYRVRSNWEEGVPRGTLEVNEVIAASPSATREIWRYLFGIDLIESVKAFFLPMDHPLPMLLEDPRRMIKRFGDNLWLRILDLPTALRSRTYGGTDALTIAVEDPMIEANTGTWQIDAAEGVAVVKRSDSDPDLVANIRDIGATYLGGTPLSALVGAGRVTETTPGAAARFDSLFRSDKAPWCPEIF